MNDAGITFDTGYVRELFDEIEKLKAENARLRVALATIAQYGEDGICPYGCDTPNIARDALSNQQEGE